MKEYQINCVLLQNMEGSVRAIHSQSNDLQVLQAWTCGNGGCERLIVNVQHVVQVQTSQELPAQGGGARRTSVEKERGRATMRKIDHM